MDTQGQHLIAEFHGCDPVILNDESQIKAVLRAAAELAGATLVQTVFHRFNPQGVTGVVVLEESHLSVHTWPEAGYAAVDFFTCGDCEPQRATAHLQASLGAQHTELLLVKRGLGPNIPMQIHTPSTTQEPAA